MATDNQRLVLASNANKSQIYYCPACHEQVILRVGKHKIAHFAHCRGSQCCFSEGETAEHLKGKQQLFEWASQHQLCPQLEVHLSQINQRPDLLIRQSKRTIALEFQCSPISVERLAERNQGYCQLGIKYWWLLGKPYQRQLHAPKVAQFTQVVKNRPALLYWDTQRQAVIVKDHYWQCSFTHKWLPPRELLRYQTRQLGRQLVGPLPTWLRRIIVASGEQPLILCPLVCHDLIASWPTTKQPVIFWRIMVINELARYSLFTFWSSREWLRLLSQVPNTEWLSFGCIDSFPFVKWLIRDFTIDLIRMGVIITCGEGYFLIARPHWFTDLGSKWRAINRARIRQGRVLK